jgi:hypothetical protein
MTMYKYCPSCRDEYRMDFERCADCDVALVHELEEENSQLPDASQLALLCDGTSAWVKILAGKLREVGIGYRLESMAALFEQGVLDASENSVGDGIFVKVADLERAKEIASKHLQQDLATVSDAAGSHEAEEDSCPACGHRVTPQNEECPDCGLAFIAN